MSQIEIPRALSDEVLSRYAQLRIDRGDREVWPPELALELNQDDMHEALRAALEGWLVEAAYCDPSDPWNVSAFSWPGSVRDVNHETPLYTLRKDKTP